MVGPVPFTLCTTPLSANNKNHHLYDDDTQMYIPLSVSNAKESIERLQHCVIAVSAESYRSSEIKSSIISHAVSISQKSWIFENT